MQRIPNQAASSNVAMLRQLPPAVEQGGGRPPQGQPFLTHPPTGPDCQHPPPSTHPHPSTTPPNTHPHHPPIHPPTPHTHLEVVNCLQHAPGAKHVVQQALHAGHVLRQRSVAGRARKGGVGPGSGAQRSVVTGRDCVHHASITARVCAMWHSSKGRGAVRGGLGWGEAAHSCVGSSWDAASWRGAPRHASMPAAPT